MNIKINQEPFPYLIVEDFYDEKELELIWEELNFYTKPGKLLEAENYSGVSDKTNARALPLDSLYVDYRFISNILNTTRKIFTSEILKIYTEIDHCCNVALRSNRDITKVRYYHDGEYYKSHVDAMFHTLAFSYFHKTPKSFTGGELYFPKYNYEFPCNDNTVIIFPSWVEHGVREVKIKDSDYYDGFGRYAITHFLSTKM